MLIAVLQNNYQITMALLKVVGRYVSVNQPSQYRKIPFSNFNLTMHCTPHNQQYFIDILNF